MKKMLIAFLFTSLMLCATAGFAGDKVYKLKMATVVTPPHPWTIAGDYMVKEIEKQTNGKVKISFHHSSSLGSDQSVIDGMRMGVIDMSIGGTSPASAFIPEFSVFSIPFLFKSYDNFNKAMANGSDLYNYFDQNIASRKLGFKLLALCGGGVRDVSNNLRPIVVPDDMKGMKMRVPANPITSKIWASTGALPSPMAWKEIYSAMQTGVVNCFDSSISGYYGSKYYEVAPFHAKSQHQFMVSFISVSDVTWKKLPAEYKAIIAKVAQEAGMVVTNTGRKFDNEKLKDLVENHGVKVNDVDTQAWVNHFAPLQDELASGLKGTKDGSKILGLIRAVK